MKKRFQIIIILMFLSLFGLIIIQGLWIKYAIETERAKFDQLVYDAMKSALQKVEQRNVFEFIDNRIELPEPDIDISFSFDELKDITGNLAEIEQVERIRAIQEAPYNHHIHYFGDSSLNHEDIIIRTPNEIRVTNNVIARDSSSGIYTYKYSNDENAFVDKDIDKKYIIELKIEDSIEKIMKLHEVELLVEKEKLVKHKLKVFNENIEQWVMEYSFDENLDYLSDRMKKYNGVIASALLNNGINLDFDYQVIKEDNDSITSIFSSNNDTLLLPQQYKTEVFPRDIFTKGLFLIINFPGKNSHIYGKVYILVLGSLIFTIIILLTFGTTLYYIQKQKKLSEVKSDFINNMTHEFKTPIATIRLATDALESPKVMGVKKTTLNYLNIIRQENKRMNNQVERVLQMALIEQNQLQVDIQENDIHSIINNCINVVELTAQKKNGKISSSLRATCHNINIDEVHIANVVNNLLDNAIKYTDSPPDIMVETYNQQDKLIVRVSDNGVGMTKEVQNHIFDKFYRKPTGNIHNIKGFGLGLSYVKAIIEAHGGSITVASEPNNGSTFIIKFNC